MGRAAAGVWAAQTAFRSTISLCLSSCAMAINDYEGDATELLETYGASLSRPQLTCGCGQIEPIFVLLDFLMKYIIIGA